MKNKIVKTKRLVLKPLTADQLEEKVSMETDDHLKKAYTEMLDGCKSHEEDQIWYTLWRITLKDSGKAVGSLSFKGKPANGGVEIGYGIETSYQQQGYGTEAVSEAVEWALSQPEVYYVSAITETENSPSKKLLKKLKFTQVQRTEEYTTFERERPKPLWKAIYVLFGLTIGYSFAAWLNQNKITYMVVGMILGFLLGLTMDFMDNRKRRNLRKEDSSK